MELNKLYNLAIANLTNSEYILKISSLTRELSPQISVLPNISLRALYNSFDSKSVDYLYAKLSNNVDDLKYLKSKNNPVINNNLIQNKHISLSSKVKIIKENNLDKKTITTAIFSFFSNNYQYIDDGLVKLYNKNISTFLDFESFLESYRDNISNFDFSDYNNFLLNVLDLKSKDIDRAISFLINNVKYNGVLLDREKFQEIVRFYSGKESIKIQFADSTISNLLPSTYLEFEHYSNLPIDQSLKMTPLAVYKYFFIYLDQISTPVDQLIEIISFMTFYNGSFKELLRLQSLI